MMSSIQFSNKLRNLFYNYDAHYRAWSLATVDDDDDNGIINVVLTIGSLNTLISVSDSVVALSFVLSLNLSPRALYKQP